MKTNWMIFGLIYLLTGCLPKDFPPNMSAIQDRFHGKYKVISSVSSEPLDVNMDGRVSTDMIQEIPTLTNNGQSFLELRIYGPSKYRLAASSSFTQWWPDQYIWVDNKKWELQPIDYKSDLIVNYGMEGVTRSFSFAQNLSKLVLDPYDYADNSLRWKKPEDITVVGEHQIQIVNRKILYTRNGVKEVIITTVYERYTTIT